MEHGHGETITQAIWLPIITLWEQNAHQKPSEKQAALQYIPITKLVIKLWLICYQAKNGEQKHLSKLLLTIRLTIPTHIDSIVEETGFDRMRKISSLNPLEFEKYWKAIEKIEKWVVGKEEFIDVWYITGVHIKRGVIQEYCIHKNGSDTWISKEEAVALASERRIHAILVHSSNGSLYLRPEYKGKRFQRLDLLIFSGPENDHILLMSVPMNSHPRMK